MRIFNFTKGLLLFAIILIYSIKTQAQINTITLQPGGTEGKDASVHSFYPNINFGTNQCLNAVCWTNSGTKYITRSLMQFDLSSIPAGSIVTDAKLSLYFLEAWSGMEQSSLSGSNETVLRRITQNWDESTVVWANQPTFTTINQVSLPQSTNPYQDYTDIDVTTLVNDMINFENYGFELQLKTEDYYRAVSFASSDYTTVIKRPLLVVKIPMQSMGH